jgi:hypothetical protein
MLQPDCQEVDSVAKEDFLSPLVLGTGNAIEVAIALAQAFDYVQSNKISIVLWGIALVLAPILIAVAMKWRKKTKVRKGAAPKSLAGLDLDRLISSVSIVVTTLAVVAIAFFAGRTAFASNTGTVAKHPEPISTTTTVTVPAPSPSTTTIAPETPQAAFTRPKANMRIDAGASVAVSGTLSDIGHDTLWLLTKPDAGGGSYFLTDNAPVATRDGTWSFPDTGVGDDSDRGKGITYLAVDADASCASKLTAAGDAVDSLPTGCTIVATVAVAVNR